MLKKNNQTVQFLFGTGTIHRSTSFFMSTFVFGNLTTYFSDD